MGKRWFFHRKGHHVWRIPVLLLALGLPHEVAHGSLRISLSEYNTEAEAEHIIKEVPQVVEYLRSMSPVWKDLQEGKKQYVIQ